MAPLTHSLCDSPTQVTERFTQDFHFKTRPFLAPFGLQPSLAGPIRLLDRVLYWIADWRPILSAKFLSYGYHALL